MVATKNIIMVRDAKKQIHVMEGIIDLSDQDDSSDQDNNTENHLQLSVPEPDHTTDITFLAISINALLGIPTLHVMTIKGMINHKSVVFLIDSSSTHSFIDDSLVNN